MAVLEPSAGPSAGLSINNSNTGYKINNKDLNELAEPYWYDADNGELYVNKSEHFGGGCYLKSGISIDQTRFSAPAGSVNELNIDYRLFNVKTKLCKKGCLPTTYSRFASITSPGTYEIIRGTDSSGDYLKIGSTYFRASSFRNNKVPEIIGVVMCAGGGGAGGFGGGTTNKNHAAQCGGGGGGGAFGSFCIGVDGSSYTLTIGSGGSCGTNTDSGGQAGGSGTKGGMSSLGPYVLNGGEAGQPGGAADSAEGLGGKGGECDQTYGNPFENSKFVAIDYKSNVGYSTDGVSWTWRPLTVMTWPRVLCYGGGVFIAGGEGGEMSYSLDGIEWVQIPSEFTSTVKGICYGNGVYLAIADKNKMAYSTDGINWKFGNLDFGDSSINGYSSICYGNGKFILGMWGLSSNSLAYSFTGLDWHYGHDQSSFTQRMRSLCYGNGKYIAGGAEGKMVYSNDGIRWTEISQSIFASAVTSICYGNGKFIAGGIDGNLAYSTDGTNWKQINQNIFGGKSSGFSVCYGNGTYVAVSALSYNHFKMGYSLDGVNWKEIQRSGVSLGCLCYESPLSDGGSGGSSKEKHLTNGHAGDSIIESFYGMKHVVFGGTGGETTRTSEDYYKNSSAGGGASLGKGGKNFTKGGGEGIVPGPGGGGASGWTNTATYGNGGNGVAYFYY